MPILPFLAPSAHPQLCLKNKDIAAQLKKPHPRLACASSHRCRESPTQKRNPPARTKNTRTWALHPAQSKTAPSLLGLCCAGEKIQRKPTATQTGQRVKTQRDLCVPKIHLWPKDGPLGTLLPLWCLKKCIKKYKKQRSDGGLPGNL